MSVNAVIINNLEEINRSLNNVTMTVRLVWVDPAPSTSREHAIRCVCSDRTRSIRLVLWGFDDETKNLLLSSLMCVIKWEGLTLRQHREPYLQREHAFGAACNREDKFNLRFVGRFQVVQQRGQGPFLDVVVPRPSLSQSGSTTSLSQFGSATPPIRPSTGDPATPRHEQQNMQSHYLPTAGSPVLGTGMNRRAREWQCPNTGCRVSQWPFCMITGRRHPPVCSLCGTQGLFRYCPATPRGQPPILHEGVEPELTEVTQVPPREPSTFMPPLDEREDGF